MPPGNKASGNASAQTGRLVGPSVFFVSFAVYLLSLAPGITFWDSPELALGAFSLGLPHPPAYPLFCMLGKAFTLLPFGGAAYRTNLLSASFGAASVWLLYFLVRELLGERAGAHWFAAACALLFAFYRSFWGVAVVTEVYTLNTFLLLAAVTAILFYEKRDDARFLLVSSFFAGLALANHQSAVFFLPPYAAYFLLSRKNYRNIPLLAASAFFFLLAYSHNIYLPVRATAAPLINVANPVTFPGFAWLMKWGEYLKAIEGLVRGLSGTRLLAMAAGAAALGVLAYALRRRPFLLFLACCAFFYFAGIYFLTYGAAAAQKWGLTAKFFIPAAMFAVLFAAAATASMTALGKAGAGFLKVASASLFAGALVLAANGWKHADQSRNFFAFDFGGNTLKSVHQDAALFGWGDNGVFPVWYLQGVEKYRDDVIYMHGELLTFDWYMAEIQKKVFKKFGIAYVPRAGLQALPENVRGLRLRLKDKTPTYFDYSASLQLKIPKENLKPQGLVHLVPFWAGSAVSYHGIWDRYVLRGALDDSTNRAFAAEGILEIYAWESAYWGLYLIGEGDIKTSITALKLAKELGLNDPKLDLWITDLEKK